MTDTIRLATELFEESIPGAPLLREAVRDQARDEPTQLCLKIFSRRNTVEEILRAPDGLYFSKRGHTLVRQRGGLYGWTRGPYGIGELFRTPGEAVLRLLRAEDTVIRLAE